MEWITAVAMVLGLTAVLALLVQLAKRSGSFPYERQATLFSPAERSF